MALQILGLVGSFRQGSYNHALCRAVGEAMPEGAALTIYEGLDTLPFFNADLKDEPAVVTSFAAAVRAADAVLFATPEYNYSLPGGLKNAIDWVSRGPQAPLKRKPVAMVGASVGMSGTMRAQYHLRQVMVYFDAPTLGQPEVLLARAQDKFDAQGRLIDEPTRAHLQKFAAAFVAFVAQQRTAV